MVEVNRTYISQKRDQIVTDKHGVDITRMSTHSANLTAEKRSIQIEQCKISTLRMIHIAQEKGPFWNGHIRNITCIDRNKK